jgi:RNA polymerase sigma factor (sigma-70 family)
VGRAAPLGKDEAGRRVSTSKRYPSLFLCLHVIKLLCQYINAILLSQSSESIPIIHKSHSSLKKIRDPPVLLIVFARYSKQWRLFMYREKQIYTRKVMMIDGNEHYYVSFNDAHGNNVEIEVSCAVYSEIKVMRNEDERQWMQQRRHYEHLSFLEMIDAQDFPEIQLEEKELNEALIRAIQMLSSTQKRRLLLRYLCNATYSQIAAFDGCSKQSVQRSVHSAIKRTKNFLKNFL